jgi:hypothetical protein
LTRRLFRGRVGSAAPGFRHVSSSILWRVRVSGFTVSPAESAKRRAGATTGVRRKAAGQFGSRVRFSKPARVHMVGLGGPRTVRASVYCPLGVCRVLSTTLSLWITGQRQNRTRIEYSARGRSISGRLLAGGGRAGMDHREISFPEVGSPCRSPLGLLPRVFSLDLAGGSKACTPQPARPFLRAFFFLFGPCPPCCAASFSGGLVPPEAGSTWSLPPSPPALGWWSSDSSC